VLHECLLGVLLRMLLLLLHSAWSAMLLLPQMLLWLLYQQLSVHVQPHIT
jgi:hypothetical protein